MGRLLVNNRLKQFIFICAAQVGCLAVGLWMQYQFAHATMVRNVEEGYFTELESIGAGLAQGVLQQLETPQDLKRYVQDGLAKTVRNQAEIAAAYVVDPQWAVRTGVSLSSNDTAAISDGNPLGWISDRSILNTIGGHALYGRVIVGGAGALAVACPLPSGSGYFVLQAPVDGAQRSVATMQRGLPAISAITVAWTFALMAIAAYIITSRFQKADPREQNRSAADALRRATDLIRTRDAVIFGLAKLADSRDPETGDHLERISVYATTLAAELMRDPRFMGQVTPSFVRLIGISAALHDIGKVGIEDRILRKPGPLTDAERQSMQLHSTIGADCLLKIEQRLGSSNFLQMAREIAVGHHERWDGFGYPSGVSGISIPLSARIVAVADVYDALSSKRVYKRAYPHEECVRIITAHSGKHFDSDIVDAWLRVEGKFATIAAQFEECQAAPSVKQGDVDDLCQNLWEQAVRDTALKETVSG